MFGGIDTYFDITDIGTVQMLKEQQKIRDYWGIFPNLGGILVRISLIFSCLTFRNHFVFVLFLKYETKTKKFPFSS